MALLGMAPSLHFDIPAAAQYFTLFARLPVEVRLMVWESTIFEPGFHYLGITPDGLQYPPEPAYGRQEPIHGILAGLYPNPKAERSRFPRLNQTLSALLDACAESRRVVEKILAHPSTIQLKDGQVVYLGGSSDIISLEFIRPEKLSNGCPLPVNVYCRGIDRLRHVALPHCHNWHTAAQPCSKCRQPHHETSMKLYPVCIWQFLARHCPSLETFYLIDYLALRRKDGVSQSSDHSTDRRQPRSRIFRSEARVFHEVPRQLSDWVLSANVFYMLDYIQSCFVSYCPLLSHDRYPKRHRDPSRVVFKVLACEWDISPAVVKFRSQATPTRKGTNKRSFAGEFGGRQEAKVFRASGSDMTAASRGTLRLTGDVFVFGQGERRNFTFRAQEEAQKRLA